MELLAERTRQQYANDAEQQGVDFAVHHRGDLSIQNLCDLRDQGYPILRSLHVGNSAPYNLALAAQGLRIAAYDRTIPARDPNYNPGYRIQAGQAEQIIAEEDFDRLTTHITSEDGSLVDAHVGALRRAFPNTPIQTMSEYFLDGTNERFFNDTVRCLVANSLGDWIRRVDNDGSVHEVTDNPEEAVEAYGVFRDGKDGNQTSGMIPPNTYNVLLVGVLDAINYQTSDVYHLSGPDMANYIKGYAPLLDEMYKALKVTSGLRHILPARLNFHIVPAASAKFAVPANRQADLEATIAAYKEWQREMQASAKRRIDIASGELTKKQKQLLHKQEQGKARLAGIALGDVISLCPEVFDTTSSRSYTSQYDVIAAEEAGHVPGLHIPEAIKHMSFDEMATMYGHLHKGYVHALKRQQ